MLRNGKVQQILMKTVGILNIIMNMSIQEEGLLRALIHHMSLLKVLFTTLTHSRTVIVRDRSQSEAFSAADELAS